MSGETVPSGTDLLLSATPDVGYSFGSWIINGVSYTNQTFTYTVTADTTISAVFISNSNPQNCIITIVNPVNGTISASVMTPPATTVAPPATTVAPPATTVAPPATTVAPPATTVAPPATTVAPPATTEAVFAPFSAPSIQITNGDTVAVGTVLVLSATPDVGYSFFNWEIDGVTYEDQSLAYTVSSDTTISATFMSDSSPPIYTITIVNPVNGTISASVGVTVMPATTEAPPATTVAPPATTEAPPATTEAVPATTEAPPATTEAVFAPFSAPTSDSTQIANGDTVYGGDALMLAAHPSTGYRFDGWLINGVSYSEQTLTYTVTSDTTISASFAINSVATDIPTSFSSVLPAVEAWNSMATDANLLLTGNYVPPSTFSEADIATFAYASSVNPSILLQMPADLDLIVSDPYTGLAMATSMAAKALNGVPPPLPIRTVTPSVAGVLPAPSIANGTYYAAIPKTISRTYNYAGSNDTLIVDGSTGNQTFVSASSGQSTPLILGAKYIFTPLTGAAVEMTVNYLGSLGSSAAPVVCFLANAPVLTPRGYRPIASLRVGDRVKTADGASSRIQRISKQCVAPSAATNPYKIPKGLFGAMEELLISPNHHVLVAGKLIEARHLGLKQKAMKGEFTYYNLELESWSNMIVAGVTVESLAPVERITVTMAEFKKMIEVRYGPMTPELTQKINNTCRFLTDGRVELPAISTKNVTRRG